MKFITIDEAYEYLKKICEEEGSLIVDERNDKLYQIPFISLTFTEEIHQKVGNIYNIKIPDGVNPNMLSNYTKQLQNGNIGDFVYTYGHRFMTYFNVNQYEYMIKKLRENKHSRRAVAITIDPRKDTQENEIPCLQLIKCSIVNNKLVMSVVFRSNDISLAFKYNMFALLNVQQYISKELGIEPSEFNYVGFDVHYRII